MSSQTLKDLGTTLAEELEQLSAKLMETFRKPRAAGENGRREMIQDRIRFMGALLAGLPGTDPAHLRRNRVGLGSRVKLRDVDTDDVMLFTIVPSDLADGAPDKVTPASPIGQAVLGAKLGSVVQVETPVRTRHMRVDEVETIWETLETWQSESAGMA